MQDMSCWACHKAHSCTMAWSSTQARCVFCHCIVRANVLHVCRMLSTLMTEAAPSAWHLVIQSLLDSMYHQSIMQQAPYIMMQF